LGAFDAIPIVEHKMKDAVDGLTSKLSAALEGTINLHDRLPKVWKEMYKPQKINGNTLLMFNPSKVYVHSVTSDNERIAFNFQVEAKPVVNTGTIPSSKVPALPDARRASQEPALNIFLPIEIPYDKIKEGLNKQFRIDEEDFVQFPMAADSSFYVADLDISGHNDKTIIRLDLAGTVKGWIYLSGDPKYDAGSNEIYFDNIEVAEDSRSWIASKAAWMTNEIAGLTQWMTRRMRVDISSQLKETRRTIDSYLNSKLTNSGTSIQLNGTLRTFDLQSLLVNKDENKVMFYFYASGDLSGVIE
jgi:hypothetical protein